MFSFTKNLDSLEFLFDFSIEERLIADEATAIMVRKLNKLINSLPPRQKEALYLRYYEGLPIEEISKVLDMNHQSAKNLLHRAILQLRKEFQLLIFLFLLRVSTNN